MSYFTCPSIFYIFSHNLEILAWATIITEMGFDYVDSAYHCLFLHR